MEKLNKTTIIGGTIIIGLLLVLVGLNFKSEAPLGSISNGSAYKSTNLLDITGSSTNATLIKGTSGTVGSVVFTGTSAQTIILYDVAVAANFASTSLSRKIMQFSTSTPAGTYTLDASFYNGLAIHGDVTPTIEGVVTWR